MSWSAWDWQSSRRYKWQLRCVSLPLLVVTALSWLPFGVNPPLRLASAGTPVDHLGAGIVFRHATFLLGFSNLLLSYCLVVSNSASQW